MASLRIEADGRFKEHGLWQRRLKVKLPLVDGRMIEAEVRVNQSPREPISALIRLENAVMNARDPDARDGVLEIGNYPPEELGVFSELCPASHVLALLQELLANHRIETHHLSLEVAKRLEELSIDETMLPRRSWMVEPAMDADGTKQLGKYLLMKRDGTEEYIVGWKSSDATEHRDIWKQHDKTENLGGGFIYLVSGFFQMTGSSLTYAQPAFDLVLDAALGLAQVVRPHIQVTEARIEGAELYQLVQERNQTTERRINRILVIDDDPLWSDIVKRRLAVTEREVIALNDPAEALRRLDSESFDLVITDRSDNDDYTYGDEIALKAKEKGIPCVMVTGDTLNDQQRQQLGLFDYVNKTKIEITFGSDLIAKLEAGK